MDRPAAAVTQLVNSIFPDALPHLELAAPPPADTIGGFVGNTLGVGVDLLLLSRLTKNSTYPKFLTPATPYLNFGQTMMLDSWLTPVKLQEGDNLWVAKLNNGGTSYLAGAASRWFMGKALVSPRMASLAAIGINAVVDAGAAAFNPEEGSIYHKDAK